MQNKERILRAGKEKGQVTYKGRPIRITPNFSMETESQKVLDRCSKDNKKPQMPAQTTITTKVFNHHTQRKEDIS